MRKFMSYIIFIFFAFPSFIHASPECFKLLRLNSEMASQFEDQFLRKIKTSKVIHHEDINYPMLDYIIDQVRRTPKFNIKEHASDTLYNSVPSHEEDLAKDAVRVAHSKTQYLGYDRENFFRFLPSTIPADLVLSTLRAAIVAGDFMPREVRYSRRDRHSPELVGDTDLKIGENVLSLRFAIVIPQNEADLPMLSLLSPLVTPQTHGKLTCVYRSPSFKDHLVITDWERGTPKFGEIIKDSSVLEITSLSESLESLAASSEKNNAFLTRYYSRAQSMQNANDRRLSIQNKSPLKKQLVDVFSKNPQFYVGPYVRDQLSPFPYYGYKGGVSFEHGAVQHALPLFSKINIRRDFTVGFFPADISRQNVLEALSQNILKGQFEVDDVKTGASEVIFALSRLQISGEIYPVEFSFKLPRNLEQGQVNLLLIHPLVDSGVTNRTVSVYLDLAQPWFLVITRWFQGKPMDGTFIER